MGKGDTPIMSIDWTKIKTIDDIYTQIPNEALYDDMVDKASSYQLRDDLTDEEVEDALFWKDFLRGVILITGMPGQGKGILLHMILYKMKRYFGVNIISDTRPRPLFGQYIPFSKSFFLEQMYRMQEMANGYPEDYDADNPPAVMPHVTEDGRWMTSRGEIFMKRAAMGLDEFGAKYMNKGEPNNPICRALLYQLFPTWRHDDLVIIGVTTEKEDLNHRCWPKLTTEIHTQRILDTSNPERLLFGIKIFPLRYITATGELEYTGKKQLLTLDGDAPRDMLGGKAWKDLYNHKQAIALEPNRGMRQANKKRRQ